MAIKSQLTQLANNAVISLRCRAKITGDAADPSPLRTLRTADESPLLPWLWPPYDFQTSACLKKASFAKMRPSPRPRRPQTGTNLVAKDTKTHCLCWREYNQLHTRGSTAGSCSKASASFHARNAASDRHQSAQFESAD